MMVRGNHILITRFSLKTTDVGNVGDEVLDVGLSFK